MTTFQKHNEHSIADGGASFKVFEVGVDDPEKYNLGFLYVEICESCSYIYSTCLHTKNQWNEEGTNLYCDLCGQDGT